jgi:hypothetical protein
MPSMLRCEMHFIMVYTICPADTATNPNLS